MFAALFAGCAEEQKSLHDIPRFDVPVVESERKSFLRNFPLLNEAEELEAPLDPVSGKAPFGALIHMPRSGKGGYCSIAHIELGRVTANAHCVDEDDNPLNYFVVFYNKRGWKRYERVVEFEFVGNRKDLDVAILRIDPEVSRHWDTVDGQPVQSRREINREIPILHTVKVWSFNPLKGNHPELAAKYHGVGMRFTPRRCHASRVPPRVMGLQPESDPNLRQPYGFGQVKPRMHWVIDACDSTPVNGNSGSLITDAEDIGRLYGSYHWNIPLDPDAPFTHFEYRGNDNQPLVLTREEVAERHFFGVATDFNYLFTYF